MFTGVITAIVSPFRNGKLDEAAFKKLLASQVEAGISGLVIAGTTGESPTLSAEEKIQLLQIAKKEIPSWVKIIMGTGTNSTAASVEFTRRVADQGADAALAVVPYYNKPGQEGLYLHYQKIAAKGGLPVILYNVPGRTGASLGVKTTLKLMQLDNIIGIKDATADMITAARIATEKPMDCCLLSGDDNTFLPFLAVGGEGIISVSANIIPNQMVQLYNAFIKNDFNGAKEIFFQILPLCQALFLESNPVPVKAALSMLNSIENELRLPLSPLSQGNREIINELMNELGLME